MIKKTIKLIITFYTTTAAMAMEQVCKSNQAAGRIVPVPGSISANCGLAWCADVESETQLLQLMTDYGIQHQGIHHCFI